MRSSDSAQLHEKLPIYIFHNLKIDSMWSHINSSTSKSELRLNHPQLTGYLCPIKSMREFNENSKESISFLPVAII